MLALFGDEQEAWLDALIPNSQVILVPAEANLKIMVLGDHLED
jgi:hypothetical protein